MQPMLNEPLHAPDSNSFSLKLVSADEVRKVITALSSPVTSSVDKLLLQMLKMSLPAAAGPIAMLFNISIKTGIFPLSWKLGQVIPVYKKGNHAEFTNYRTNYLLVSFVKSYGACCTSAV